MVNDARDPAGLYRSSIVLGFFLRLPRDRNRDAQARITLTYIILCTVQMTGGGGGGRALDYLPMRALCSRFFPLIVSIPPWGCSVAFCIAVVAYT